MAETSAYFTGFDEKPQPSFGELVTSALIRESLPVALYYDWSRQKSHDPQPGYDSMADELVKSQPADELPFYAYSASPAETLDIFEARKTDKARAKLFEEGGWKANVATVLGSLANVSTFAPILRVTKAPGLANAAVQGGLTLAEQTALAELDGTRTPGEIAFGALVSGGVGYAIGRMTMRAPKAMDAYERVMDDMHAPNNTVRNEPIIRGEPAQPPVAPTEFTPEGPRPAAASSPLRPNEAEINAHRAERVAEMQSVGAAAQPASAAARTAQMIGEDLTMKNAFGVERVPFNPQIEGLNSPNPQTRIFTEATQEIGPMLVQDDKFARSVSIESRLRLWRGLEFSLIRAVEDAHLMERLGRAGTATDVLRVAAADSLSKFSGTKVDDLAKFVTGKRIHEMAAPGRSLAELSVAVGKAMRRGDVSPDPVVAKLAGELRAMVDKAAQEAADVGAFEGQQAAKKNVLYWSAQLQDPAVAGNALRAQEATDKLMEAEKKLGEVMGKVPETKTAESWLHRLWDQSAIRTREGELEEILFKWVRRQGAASDAEARDIAKKTIIKLKHDEPFQNLDNPDVTGMASGLHERALNIPDALVEDFLESDVLVVLPTYLRKLGADIEIVRYENSLSDDLGLINMKHSRDLIHEWWMDQIAKAPAEAKAGMKLKMARDLEIAEGIRDRLRGTTGLTREPWTLSNRLIRGAKQAMTVLYMGSAALTAATDLVRPVMVEGLERTLAHGYAPLFSDAATHIRQMTKQELRMGGTAFGNSLALRAQVLLDTGDAYSRYTKAERVLSKMADSMFVVNGLNWIDEEARTIAGQVVMTRMLDDIEKLAAGTLDDAGKARLNRAFIDEAMASRIAGHKQHWEEAGGVRLANTQAWNDPIAQETFVLALGQDVDRVVPLRGIGETPLFMSTPMGSLLTQFRSFGFSAIMRTTIPALQARDRNAFTGFAMMAAMAGIINEFRDGLNDFQGERTLTEKIGRAVDRSGVAGIVGDVAGIASRIAERGLEGASTATPPTSAAYDLGAMLTETFQHGYTDEAAHGVRRLWPYGTVFWLDGLWDKLVSP